MTPYLSADDVQLCFRRGRTDPEGSCQVMPVARVVVVAPPVHRVIPREEARVIGVVILEVPGVDIFGARVDMELRGGIGGPDTHVAQVVVDRRTVRDPLAAATRAALREGRAKRVRDRCDLLPWCERRGAIARRRRRNLEPPRGPIERRAEVELRREQPARHRDAVPGRRAEQRATGRRSEQAKREVRRAVVWRCVLLELPLIAEARRDGERRRCVSRDEQRGDNERGGERDSGARPHVAEQRAIGHGLFSSIGRRGPSRRLWNAGRGAGAGCVRCERW